MFDYRHRSIDKLELSEGTLHTRIYLSELIKFTEDKFIKEIHRTFRIEDRSTLYIVQAIHFLHEDEIKRGEKHKKLLKKQKTVFRAGRLLAEQIK